MSTLKAGAAAALLWLSICSSPGMAQEIFIDGSTLYRWCTVDYSETSDVCRGYVSAVVDVLASNNVNNLRGCIPPYTITPAKAVGIVKDWLRHHYDQSYYGADVLVAKALQDAFPCE